MLVPSLREIGSEIAVPDLSTLFWELLELVRLVCVGKLVCMVGEHLVEHENPFPVGSVIRKAVDWLLFRVHAVRASCLNEDAGREGEMVPPIREGCAKDSCWRRNSNPQLDCQT